MTISRATNARTASKKVGFCRWTRDVHFLGGSFTTFDGAVTAGGSASASCITRRVRGLGPGSVRELPQKTHVGSQMVDIAPQCTQWPELMAILPAILALLAN